MEKIPALTSELARALGVVSALALGPELGLGLALPMVQNLIHQPPKSYQVQHQLVVPQLPAARRYWLLAVGLCVLQQPSQRIPAPVSQPPARLLQSHQPTQQHCHDQPESESLAKMET